MKKASLTIFLLIIFLIIFLIFARNSIFRDGNDDGLSGSKVFNDIREVKITNDFEGAKVERDDLQRGCPRKDCIPSIDEPQFESVVEADEWLNDEDRIFGLNYRGEQRAYAQRILNWHEIVNDEIAGEPVAVTFCPLCGTAVSFVRKVDGTPAEFGVSGYLHNNDLVMYDRLEGNLWQQITAEAIVGPAARRDEELQLIRTITTSWDDWKKKYPSSQVLSIPQGFIRDYSQYPYGTYEEDGEIYFGLQNSDERLHPKEVVYGVIINEQAKAYPLEKIETKKRITDTVGGENIVVEYRGAGEIEVINEDTGENYIPQRSFWFAWAAFNPGTEIY